MKEHRFDFIAERKQGPTRWSTRATWDEMKARLAADPRKFARVGRIAVELPSFLQSNPMVVDSIVVWEGDRLAATAEGTMAQLEEAWRVIESEQVQA